MKHINNHFPAPSYRGGQKEAIDEIQEAFDHGYDVVLLDAPTGSGKSIINTAACRAAKHSYYTAPYNYLLDQIMEDDLINKYFSHIKGRKHYECHKGGEDGSMCPSVRKDNYSYPDNGPAGNPFVYKKAWEEALIYDPPTDSYLTTRIDPARGEVDIDREWVEKNTCEYAKEVVHSLKSPNVLTNFWYFLQAPHFLPENPVNPTPKRELLVIDEAHDLPAVIRQNSTVSITQGWINEQLLDTDVDDRYLPDTNIDVPSPDVDEDDAIEWVSNEFRPFLEEIKTVIGDIESRSEEEQSLLNRVDSRLNSVETILDFSSGGDNIVIGKKENMAVKDMTDRGTFKPDADGIKITPIEVGNMFKAMVKSKASKIILSSATMFKFKARELGISEREMYKVEVDHNIPAERRGAHYFPVANMKSGGKSKREKKDDINDMAKAIAEIMKTHSNEKGIVHTNSFKRTKQLVEALPRQYQRRSIAYDDATEPKEDIKEEFFDSAKGVLFSPAHTTGIDLRDDMARFNVIAKVPYPPMGDGTIWGDVSWERYAGTAFMKLVQASGRTTRGNEDYSTTYILDSGFGSLRKSLTNELKRHWFFDQTHFHRNDLGDWLDKHDSAESQLEERR